MLEMVTVKSPQGVQVYFPEEYESLPPELQTTLNGRYHKRMLQFPVFSVVAGSEKEFVRAVWSGLPSPEVRPRLGAEAFAKSLTTYYAVKRVAVSTGSTARKPIEVVTGLLLIIAMQSAGKSILTYAISRDHRIPYLSWSESTYHALPSGIVGLCRKMTDALNQQIDAGVEVPIIAIDSLKKLLYTGSSLRQGGMSNIFADAMETLSASAEMQGVRIIATVNPSLAQENAKDYFSYLKGYPISVLLLERGASSLNATATFSSKAFGTRPDLTGVATWEPEDILAYVQYLGRAKIGLGSQPATPSDEGGSAGPFPEIRATAIRRPSPTSPLYDKENKE